MTPPGRWPADEPWMPVELLLVRLAAGWDLADAAHDAGIPLPLAGAAAALHSYPDDMGTVRARAAEAYRRHGVENPTYPLPPPTHPDAPGDTMTEPPTAPTGIPLEPEGQSQPATAATDPDVVRVEIPRDLDRDVDLADIREHERELYRAKHEEGRHDQVPGFAATLPAGLAAEAHLERQQRARDAGSFLAELGRRTVAARGGRPPIRHLEVPGDVVRPLEGPPARADDGKDPRFYRLAEDPGQGWRTLPDDEVARLVAASLPDRDQMIVERFGPPPMIGSVVWPGPDPREDVAEATADPLLELDAVPVDDPDDGPFDRAQRARLAALVEARDLMRTLAPSAGDLVLIAEFIITGRSS